MQRIDGIESLLVFMLCVPGLAIRAFSIRFPFWRSTTNVRQHFSHSQSYLNFCPFTFNHKQPAAVKVTELRGTLRIGAFGLMALIPIWAALGWAKTFLVSVCGWLQRRPDAHKMKAVNRKVRVESRRQIASANTAATAMKSVPT